MTAMSKPESAMRAVVEGCLRVKPGEDLRV